MAMGAVAVSSLATLAFPTAVGRIVDLLATSADPAQLQMLVGVCGWVGCLENRSPFKRWCVCVCVRGGGVLLPLWKGFAPGYGA